MTTRMLIHLDDPDDARLEPFRRSDRRLSDRIERRDDAGAGLFVAEGDLVVERALDARCRPVSALVDGDIAPPLLERLAAVTDVLVADEQVRRQVTGFGVVHPIIALFERPARPTARELMAGCDRLILLEAVDNPVNVGSIVRNASALGWSGLILDRTSADPLARRALRVAMGTAFTLPHARTDDLVGVIAELRDLSVPVMALTPDRDAVDIGELGDRARSGPIAVAIGAERDGLSPAVLTAATWRARIPMTPGVDSLNAAAATAIACYVLRR